MGRIYIVSNSLFKTPWVSRILKINIQEWLSIVRLPLPYWEVQIQNSTDIMTLKFHENEKLVRDNPLSTANHSLLYRTYWVKKIHFLIKSIKTINKNGIFGWIIVVITQDKLNLCILNSTSNVKQKISLIILKANNRIPIPWLKTIVLNY